MSPLYDPFPPSDFDHWAAHYDKDVDAPGFPFNGYRRVLAEVVRLAEPKAGMTVLDLGAGTGNLAERFARLGCDLWCTDFSLEMIKLARAKVPSARFFLHDLRRPIPPELARRFNRIVSAYVFHHFALPDKIALVERLVRDHLSPGGQVVIADISFSTPLDLDAVRRESGSQWEEEPHWVAEHAVPALQAAGLTAAYVQVSDCAGVYQITPA